MLQNPPLDLSNTRLKIHRMNIPWNFFYRTWKMAEKSACWICVSKKKKHMIKKLLHIKKKKTHNINGVKKKQINEQWGSKCSVTSAGLSRGGRSPSRPLITGHTPSRLPSSPILPSPFILTSEIFTNLLFGDCVTPACDCHTRPAAPAPRW